MSAVTYYGALHCERTYAREHPENTEEAEEPQSKIVYLLVRVAIIRMEMMTVPLLIPV